MRPPQYCKMNFKFYCLFFFTFSFSVAIAQPRPFLQRALGGFGDENAVAFTQTFDKGYVILSNNETINTVNSGSIMDGDVITDSGIVQLYDNYSWVVKIDSAQNVLWRFNIDKTAFPQLVGEIMKPGDIIQTKDSGIVVVGYSYNGFAADEINSWAFKFTKNGQLVWKYIRPVIPSPAWESFSEVKEAPDGSLAIVGMKNLNRFSVAPTNLGWLLILNSNGTLKWDRTYKHDQPYKNLVFKTIDIEENNFLIGGDKDDSFGMIRPDLYLFKTNFNGDSLWSKTYGGYGEEKLKDVLSLPDGYLLAGTASYNDHDVTGIHCINGATSCMTDAWILKVDKNGTIIWQKTIGDIDEDIPGKLALSPDGYLVVGSSNSIYIPTKGGYDAWSLEYDKNGNIITNRVFYGGPKDDYAVSVLIDYSGGKSYPVILCTTASESGGDVEGFHDYQAILNETDAWIFKLGYFNKITGTIFYDLNKNGIKEANEPLFKRGIVSFATPADSLLYYNTAGQYSIKLEESNYTVPYHLDDSAFQVVPVSRNVNFSGYFTSQNQDFALQLRPGISDISISASPANRARPGFQASYDIMLFNRSGDTVRNQEFYFIKDSRTNFVSSTPAYYSIKGDTMVFKYSNLKFADTLRYTVVLDISTPPVVKIGDTLSHLILAPLLNDVDTLNNYSILKQVVRGSYDPNDKWEAHEGTITPSQASKGEYLNYLIRFQNTGTDTAFTVIVRDTLDEGLDLSSFEMINASHPYSLSIRNNIAEWKFVNIVLPDSTSNEKASHGYISYKLRTRKNLASNSSLYNSASIYFDFNLPVKTNTTKTLIRGDKVPGDSVNPIAGVIKLSPNPTSEAVEVRIKSNSTAKGVLRIFDLEGRLRLSKDLGILNANQEYINHITLSLYSSGIYTVMANIGSNTIIQKLLVLKQ